ncbi:hypothetical protein PRELSG_0924900 [Plasmodium relictum]|uniref:Uncharacterized protein n=1 Tax=Plasmodium relictum TaxID=85471 RepID=A0A1J1H974_PLARL|nr:hypothetical protein PRELSG_0924900 [Plasmodium relictum]CRH00149.1 hypothetical protein PRELSG_0924900 [Plasmodium relictum]
MIYFERNIEENFSVVIETPMKTNSDQNSIRYVENQIKNISKNYLNNCYLKKLEENSNTCLKEKSDTYLKNSDSVHKKYIENSNEKNYDLIDLDIKKLHILEKKINEINYWENEIQNLKKKKKEAFEKKVKLHLELMKYNNDKKKLEEIEYIKKSKINEQLAVLARAEYAKEVIERNIISKKIVKEDNINLVLLSLKNLKTHIEYTYLNKEKEKKNKYFFSL